MLNGRLQLHDITDTEGFCRRIIDNWQKRTRARLPHHDYDDLLAELIGICWYHAEHRYDPTRGVYFRTYIWLPLNHAITEWLRRTNGRTRWQFADRTYERERPTILSLNAPTGGEHGELGDSLPIPRRGLPTDSHAALLRTDRERHRHRTRDVNALRRTMSETS